MHWKRRRKDRTEKQREQTGEEHQCVTSVTTAGRQPHAWTQELLSVCGKSDVWERSNVGLIVSVCLVFQCRAADISAWPAHCQ